MAVRNPSSKVGNAVARGATLAILYVPSHCAAMLADHGAGLGIVQHAGGLGLDRGDILQSAGIGGGGQCVIRHGGPQKV